MSKKSRESEFTFMAEDDHHQDLSDPEDVHIFQKAYNSTNNSKGKFGGGSGDYPQSSEDEKYDIDDIVVELKVILAKVERDIKRHCNHETLHNFL